MATTNKSKLNMTRMYIMHDALRRELERIARVTAPHRRRPQAHHAHRGRLGAVQILPAYPSRR